MKVNDPRLVNPAKIYEINARKAQIRKGNTKTAAKKDTVELSPDAQMIRRLVQQVSDLPEVRDKLVEGLCQKVKEGTYHVPIDRLVQKLVKEIRGENS